MLYGEEVGGLLGKLVLELFNQVICGLKVEVGDVLFIIGVGGIFSGVDVCVKIDVGVLLVQLYIGLIYQGLVLVYECVEVLCVLQGLVVVYY